MKISNKITTIYHQMSPQVMTMTFVLVSTHLNPSVLKTVFKDLVNHIIPIMMIMRLKNQKKLKKMKSTLIAQMRACLITLTIAYNSIWIDL